MQTAVPLKALFLSLLVACSCAATLGSRPAAAFVDVPIDHWAYGDVTMLVELGLVGGYDDGTYRPTDPVDRGQMAVYIGRTLRSNLVSAKPGWVEFVDETTNRVHAPKEPRATEYRLYVSDDCGRTWQLDETAVPVESFFDVYWECARVALPNRYRPVALIGTVERDLCGVLDGDTLLMSLPYPQVFVGIDGITYTPMPDLYWLCDGSSFAQMPCVSFWVLRVEVMDGETVVGTAYEAVLEPWVRVLRYGRQVGWPGVVAAKLDPARPVLDCGGTFRVTVWAVQSGGNASHWHSSATWSMPAAPPPA